MSLIYPNIVPEDNLRLPDALTIKHGPARLLSRFLLEGDKAARELGLFLRIRNDFEELQRLNRQEVSRGRWYPLVNMFNPEQCELIPENSYWLSGEDKNGDIVVTIAWRIYYWPDSNLHDEAQAIFYQREKGLPCEFTPEAEALTKQMSGVVLFGGAAWVRPDFRGRKLMHLLPRIGRAYGLARWPVDWCVTIVAPPLVEKGVAAGYGYKHECHSIIFHGAPSGYPEEVLVYVSPDEVYEDLLNFLIRELSPADEEETEKLLDPNRMEHMVSKISREGVFQGSSSRS